MTSTSQIAIASLALCIACKTAPQPSQMQPNSNLPDTPSSTPTSTPTPSAAITPAATPTPNAEPVAASPAPTLTATPAATPPPVSMSETRAFIEQVASSSGDSLEQLKNAQATAKNDVEKTVTQLGLAAWKARHGEFADAYETLVAIQESSPTVLSHIKNMLLAETSLQLGKPELAASALEDLAHKKNSPFYKQASAQYFRALLLLKDLDAAKKYLKANTKTLLSSSNTITILPESLILDENIFNRKAQLEIARKLMRDFGSQPQLRNLGFKIAHINESQPVPSKPVDALSLPEKEGLLRAADLLVSAWEYPLAQQILNYLKQAKIYGKNFGKIDVLMLSGRALNASEQYAQASMAYKEALRSPDVKKRRKEALDRLAMSLHFSQDYNAEIALLETMAKRSSKKQKIELLWKLYWAQYLNEDYENARKTGTKIFAAINDKQKHGTMAHSILYWNARIHENTNNKNLAINDYNIIIKEHAESHFAVFARWRLDLMDASQVKNTAIATNSNSLPNLQNTDQTFAQGRNEKENSAIDTVRMLNKAGLFRFANPLFDNIQLNSRVSDDDLKFAQKAFSLQKYRRAISLVEELGTSRFAKGVSRSELYSWMKENSAFWQIWFPRPYENIVRGSASRFEISESLLWSIARKESVFETTATSPVGALGLMQIMPRTAFRISSILKDTEFQPLDLYRPEVSIVYGAWYLGHLIKYYQGNELLAAAAYNGGPAAVDRWIRMNPNLALDEFLQNIPFDQTRDYVQKITRYMNTYLQIYSQTEYKMPSDEELPDPNKSMDVF